MQNPGEMRKFDDVTQWLRETSGVPLEGVPLEEFRQRISQAVVDKERTSGVLPQVLQFQAASPLSGLALTVFLR